MMGTIFRIVIMRLCQEFREKSVNKDAYLLPLLFAGHLSIYLISKHVNYHPREDKASKIIMQ